MIDSYSVDRKELVELDEDVIYGGSLIGHFGHFMAECWDRLWYLLQHPELQSKILFITMTHGGWHSGLLYHRRGEEFHVRELKCGRVHARLEQALEAVRGGLISSIEARAEVD